MTKLHLTEVDAIDAIDTGTIHLTNVDVVSTARNRQQVRGFTNDAIVINIPVSRIDQAVDIADRLARMAGLPDWGNR